MESHLLLFFFSWQRNEKKINATIKCGIESYEFSGETNTNLHQYVYSIYILIYSHDLGESHSSDTFLCRFYYVPVFSHLVSNLKYNWFNSSLCINDK